MSSSCTSHKAADLASIEETFRKADASIQNAITQKNIDSLLAFYAEDASLLPTAEPIVTGKTGIRNEWLHIFEIPDFTNKSTLTSLTIPRCYGWRLFKSHNFKNHLNLVVIVSTITIERATS